MRSIINIVAACCMLFIFAECKKVDDTNKTYVCNSEAFLYRDTATMAFLPTAFTPNSDGKNDILRAQLVNAHYGYDLSVLSANDEVIFETRDASSGWDGKLKNGEAAPAGIYHVYLHFVPDAVQALTSTQFLCVTLFRPAVGGCINTGGEIYYFEDQFDPATFTIPYPTSENICP